MSLKLSPEIQGQSLLSPSLLRPMLHCRSLCGTNGVAITALPRQLLPLGSH